MFYGLISVVFWVVIQWEIKKSKGVWEELLGKPNSASVFCSIEIFRYRDTFVEVRGLALEQWLEIAKLKDRSVRAKEYLADLNLWAQRRLVDPASVMFKDVIIDRDGTACTTFRSATLIYHSFGPRVVIFWLSGLFRPLTEFGISQTIH